MKPRYLFSYYPSTGLQRHKVVDQLPGRFVIEPHPGAFACRSINESDLDGPVSSYFTSARGAIAAFITRAEAASVDLNKGPLDRKGWREALEDARKALAQQTKSKGRKKP